VSPLVVGGTGPFTLDAGSTLVVSIDDVTITVTFDSGDYTSMEVQAAIDAAFQGGVYHRSPESQAQGQLTQAERGGL
jgi:hypothetical protein